MPNPSPKPKWTAVTADDWGMSPAINEGILELARLGVVNRVAVMANTKYVAHLLPELLSLPHIKLGIHFNLTYGKALCPDLKSGLFRTGQLPSLKKLALLSCLVKSTLEDVSKEFISQISRLKELGIKPVFFNSHQHAHIFPGIMKAIAQPLSESGIKEIRTPIDWGLLLTRRFPVPILGAIFNKLADQFPETRGFYYPSLDDFKNPARIAHRLELDPNLEVIVHPAARADAELYECHDTYVNERVVEYRGLLNLAKSLSLGPLADNRE